MEVTKSTKKVKPPPIGDPQRPVASETPGKKRQRFAHKVTASPLEPSMMKSLERAEKSNIQGLPAFCSAKDIPRRKRTKRGDGVKNAINSERTGLEVLIPSTECRRPCQKRKCKEVPAQSTDSEQTVPCFTRIRGQTRRRGTGNGTDQGKLNSSLLNNYLGNMWQSIPRGKKESSTYMDCLWFTMYHEQSQREKVLRWIVREKIFSKKYVFLPICQWFLLGVYKAEKRPETKKLIDKIPLLVPKVPQQRDDKECGYYVLYYIKLFLMNSPKSISKSKSSGYPYFVSSLYPYLAVSSVLIFFP
uniref:Ubiquitin-like protease family profile domain-containing protein n=1 Tax=Daucus carota subsp. sativus TaxID=79200 RepID=A0A166EJG1_DAUCS